MENKDDDESKGLVYDLRQTYALIVGETLKLCFQARIEERWTDYLKYLKHLYIVVKHKIESEEDTKEDDKRDNYESLYKEALIVINKNSQVYLNNISDAKAKNDIETALNKLEQYLYNKMNSVGMFGKGYEYDADEI